MWVQAENRCHQHYSHVQSGYKWKWKENISQRVELLTVKLAIYFVWWQDQHTDGWHMEVDTKCEDICVTH